MRARFTLALALGMACAGGCDALPELTFSGDENDAAVNDATASDAKVSDAMGNPTSANGDASSSDAALPGDVSLGEDGSDSQASGVDAAEGDTGAPPPGDASFTACLPSGAPPEAMCCPGGVPCIGPACSNCTKCACALGDYCCAVENPGGKVMSFNCTNMPQTCPLTGK